MSSFPGPSVCHWSGQWQCALGGAKQFAAQADRTGAVLRDRRADGVASRIRQEDAEDTQAGH